MTESSRQYPFPVAGPLKQPRWLAQWYAHAHGFFWLPCNTCGQMYSGREWGNAMRDFPDLVHAIPAPDGPKGCSIGICLPCAQAGRGWRDPQLDIDHDNWLRELGIDPEHMEEP